MEEALLLEKERAQVTLNCIGDAVVCTDIAGNITFLNPVAEKMTGWSLLEAAAGPWPRSFGPWTTSAWIRRKPAPELAVLQDRSVHLPPSCILIRRDGLEIPIEESVARSTTGRAGHRRRHRVPRRQRRAGDGAADDPFRQSTTF
jgi:PAS domain-containing protein